jgi:radical SAM superfamily enzyme YgiQ (UPF0313 family)
MPAFELLDLPKYNRLTVQASRGCPWHCEFCGSSLLLSPRYKQKPVERVLGEIDRIRDLWPHPFLEFADDNACVNRPYWKKLSAELRNRHVRWFVETDLSIHEDEELLQLMHAGGCAEVLIGLESPTESALAGIESKCDWKRHRWPEYREAVTRIQGQGIRVNGCFVLGLDGHTPDVFDAVYDFCTETELFDVQITIPTPFPGTALYDRLRRENRLLYDGEWQRCTLFDIMFRPHSMSIEQLQEGFRRLAARLYSEELTRWRRDNFNRKYLRSVAFAEET